MELVTTSAQGRLEYAPNPAMGFLPPNKYSLSQPLLEKEGTTESEVALYRKGVQTLSAAASQNPKSKWNPPLLFVPPIYPSTLPLHPVGQ